jgi:Tfp pilus assembly protein PilN
MMIKVNLKPGAKRQDQRGQALAGLGAMFKGLGRRLGQPGPAIAGAAWVLAGLFLLVVYLHTGSQLGTLAPQLQTAQSEYHRYENFVHQKAHENLIRDSILNQIGTIAAVDQDRYTWSHILDEIAGALPDMTWLTSIANVPPPANTEPDSTGSIPVTVQIDGMTNDLQNYTAFLRRLEESPWLADVVPVSAKTVVEGNRPLTQFTIHARFARPDSSHIHTVPVLQSTVR